MTPPQRAAALSPRASEILTSLYRHRLLSTRQIHVLHAPACTGRGVRWVLARLEEAGYVERVRVSGTRQTAAWFASRLGAEAVEGAGVAPRPYRVTPERARGPLQAHTLAVNDVGIAFVDAARRRGEDFDASGWRHEATHPISQGRKTELVIADAVLDYTVHEDDGEVFVCRFVELDRGTMSVRELEAKLVRYARLYHFNPNPGPGQAQPGGWRQSYPRFPKVMVVMCGLPAPALRRRVHSLLELARRDPELLSAPAELGISFTTLEELGRRGPFAPIFWRPAGLDVAVDVLGRRCAATAEAASGRAGPHLLITAGGEGR
ncbi:MAG: replication-relaxation family protein [Actinomycetota bacterium]|nr:replication-relaxation family protein [Actinomycetota bacterium]